MCSRSVWDETGNEPGTAPGPRLVFQSDLPHFIQPQRRVHEKASVFFGRDLAPTTISLEFFQSLGFHCFESSRNEPFAPTGTKGSVYIAQNGIDLTGKRALVCGSTQGIGWATALELAELGAEVILMARDASKLKKRASELSRPEAKNTGMWWPTSTILEAVAKAVDALVSEKPVQILINNTGGPPPGPAHLADVADFRSAFELHLVNNQRLLQSCLPGMKQAGFGRVVNVISTSVRIPLKGLGVSNTIRGAVASWAKTVSNEVAGFGITVEQLRSSRGLPRPNGSIRSSPTRPKK